MATGLSPAGANTALDAIRTDTPYIQLHVGDPGAAGTANKAAELTRKAVTFSAATNSAGVSTMVNSAQVQWVGISTGAFGSQDATHFSLWRGTGAATDGTGTFCFSGTITANPYSNGDTYTAGAGAIVLTISTAG